jgi:hypothetical protein
LAAAHAEPDAGADRRADPGSRNRRARGPDSNDDGRSDGRSRSADNDCGRCDRNACGDHATGNDGATHDIAGHHYWCHNHCCSDNHVWIPVLYDDHR